MRFTVDPWDPTYGVSAEGDPAAVTSAEVNLAVERPAGEWAPVAPPATTPLPEAIVFVDGVRRVEARVWIADGDGAGAEPGICASYAAGSVRCDHEARVIETEVGRGVWSASPAVADVDTSAGRFVAGGAADSTPEQLSLALQASMTAAEVRVAERARQGSEDLVVVDGPLRGRQHLRHTVGLVKTHHVRYLPPECDRVVAALRAGERTPVFLMRSSWSRHSWYLRLPGPTGGPWAGVVRCEAPADLAPAAAVALADVLARALPRFASEPHKDTRAPQNLYPIAGLERALRRRLGDPQVLYRALVRAAAR